MTLGFQPTSKTLMIMVGWKYDHGGVLTGSFRESRCVGWWKWGKRALSLV